MSRSVSPSTGNVYGVARVAMIWGVPRSTFYASLHRRSHPKLPGKRGPQAISDAALVQEIRQVIEESAFLGEGYRKIWARLRYKGVRVWKERVLRLMREHQLLSPHRQAAVVLERAHEGVIVTSKPPGMRFRNKRVPLLARHRLHPRVTVNGFARPALTINEYSGVSGIV